MMHKLKPRKILMTADTVGGVWTYALELAKALQKFSVEIHLATMGAKLSPDQREEVNALSNVMVYESNYALEWMENPWQDVAEAGKWLLALERKIQPDLIHLNNYAHGALSWEVPVLMVGHSCVLSWWQSVKKEEAPANWHIYAAKVKAGLQQADCVVGITQYMMDALHQLYGPFTACKVIYNARERNGFKPAVKEPFIFSMGRLWDEAKNIQALQHIANHLSWPVYVAGEDHGQLEKTDNFHLMGHLSTAEVAEQLSRASIYVMPARYEPFGLSILEAALSGCALVLGDIPSLREVWGDTALFADPDDPQTLRKQIKKLIQQPKLRQEMAGKAMKKAEKFSTTIMARQYMNVYQMMVSKEELGVGGQELGAESFNQQSNNLTI